jgi:hypothetical protein
VDSAETATYGLEFVAARHSTEQIIDHRISLRYLGVPIWEHTYMFRDNESVVVSGSKVDVKLHKRHTALSFHWVREAIAAGVLEFYHIAGTINLADILSKHWGISKFCRYWDRWCFGRETRWNYLEMRARAQIRVREIFRTLKKVEDQYVALPKNGEWQVISTTESFLQYT